MATDGHDEETTMTDFSEFDSWLGAGDRDDPYADERAHLVDDIDSLSIPVGHRMLLTCMACPEQYELRDADDQMVAYFRLRHGYFRVDVPDVFGETVFQHEFDDGWLGVFPDSANRRELLQKGIDAAVQHTPEEL